MRLEFLAGLAIVTIIDAFQNQFDKVGIDVLADVCLALSGWTASASATASADAP